MIEGIEFLYKCWVNIKQGQNNLGFVTDVYPPNRVEIFDAERKVFYIKLDTEIEMI